MLRVEGLCLAAGAFRLEDLSFHVPRGGYVAVLGSTGAGKTVLLESLVGLRRVGKGGVFLEGREITRLPPERRCFGVVYQDCALFPHLTVFENIAFGLKRRGEGKASVRKAVLRISEFLDLDALLSRRPGGLSGGESRRVALARALVLEPKMLFLDEPLASMDRPARARIRDELARIHETMGVTVFHVTHDREDAFHLADRLLILRAGRIVQQGAPEEILAAPADPFVAGILGVENVLSAELPEEGRIEVPGLGGFRGRPAFGRPPSGRRRGWAAVRGWAVVPFPSGEEGGYAWRGKAIVRRVLPSGDRVEIALETGTGVRLKAALSVREWRCREGIEPGREVPVGILACGIHWMAERSGPRG